MGYGSKLMAGLLGICLIATAAQARAAPVLTQGVDAYLAPLLGTNNFSGVVLVTKGDQVVFGKGYGFANLEHRVSNDPATVFQIASVSKPFTAAAVLLLAEQGRIDLKAPLSAILPDYPHGDRLTIHTIPYRTSFDGKMIVSRLVFRKVA